MLPYRLSSYCLLGLVLGSDFEYTIILGDDVW